MTPGSPRQCRFWDERLALDGMIVEQAIERGEVAPDTQPRQLIESVLGPIHLRLLLTGEPMSRDVLQAIVDIVVDGIALRSRQGRRTATR
jgi:hypothetical protein